MVSVRTSKKALTAYVSPELYSQVMDFIADDNAPYSSVSEYVTGLIYRDISVRASLSGFNVSDSFVETLLNAFDVPAVRDKVITMVKASED